MSLRINSLPNNRILTGILCLLSLCLAFIFSGCDDEKVPPRGQYGVVATVNGSPISLQYLQAKYDFNNLTWSTSAMPTADDLQRQYGNALTELIIAKLMEQELKNRDITISDAELKAAEDQVRADYPEGDFERSLVEDYIDIDIWRAFLHQRLITLKFIDTVLRPEITISPADMEAYYQKHIEEYTLPVREHFIVVDCENKDTAEKLRKDYLRDKRTPSPTDDGEVNVREITANKERLPQPWLEALSGLQSKDASGVKFYEQRYQFIIFLEQLPKQVLDLTTAYSRVEAGLVESRSEAAFDHWLGKVLKDADIRVSRPLLEAWNKSRAKPEASEAQNDGSAPQFFGNVTIPAQDEGQGAAAQSNATDPFADEGRQVDAPRKAPADLQNEEGTD